MLQTLLSQESSLALADHLAMPDVFCWTKMGTEAGQSLDAIIRRKELERRAGGGVFAWGIGNSLGTSADLARSISPTGEVDVIFTPMKSAPKSQDVAPSQLVLWLDFSLGNGGICSLPSHTLVTSRGGAAKRNHYALLCCSDTPIDSSRDCFGGFDMSEVRNLASDNPIGASQVTSVVRYRRSASGTDRTYQVAFKARMYNEGFVRLATPVVLDSSLRSLYEMVCQSHSAAAWLEGVTRLKLVARQKAAHDAIQQELFVTAV